MSAFRPLAPLHGPAAWTAALKAEPERWTYRLSAAEIAEIDEGLRLAGPGFSAAGQVVKDSFPLPALSATLKKLAREVTNGQGVMLVKGLPFERYSDIDAARIALGIAAHVGDLVSQNAEGHLVGHVTDLGRVMADVTARGYQTSAQLNFHTDYSDIVMLACLRPARSGGTSLIASAVAIHDALLERRPELLQVLYEPFYTDHRGEEPEGEAPYYMLPVFNRQDDQLIARFSRSYIQSAQRFPEVPRLTDAQLEALAMIGSLAASPEFCLDMELETGDLQLLSNYTVLHARTQYEDHEDPGRRRHLLRFWVNFPERPALPVFELPEGRVDVGMLRRGVPPKPARPV